MPYKSQKKGILIPRELKKGVKIPIEEHENVKLHYLESKSQRATAAHFGVSRQLIRYICFPDKLARNRELLKERRKDGRYYYKGEKHNGSMREVRKRKKELFDKGLCIIVQQ